MDHNESGGKLVVGVDGSAGSRAALAWALNEAGRRDAEVEAVFAWAVPSFAYAAPGAVLPDPETMAAEGTELLEQALALVSAATQAKVHTRVREGRPSDVLQEVADEPDVRLLVVGSRGHGGLAELVLGSVSHAVSHHVRKPLVIIPKRVAENPPPPPKSRIVVGVDGSPAAEAALQWAVREARLRGATLEVAVAWSASRAVFPTRFPVSGSVEVGLRQAAQEIADRAVARVAVPGVCIEPRVLRGDASAVLIQQAGDSDLLVVGRRGLNRAQETVLGSVSHASAHHSPVPVAIIPHGEA
jgi:nucleotide-binding universal stress UspA family protein